MIYGSYGWFSLSLAAEPGGHGMSWWCIHWGIKAIMHSGGGEEMMRMHLPLHSFRRHVPRGLQFRVGGEGHFPCGRLASSHGCGGVPPRPLAGLIHICACMMMWLGFPYRMYSYSIRIFNCQEYSYWVEINPFWYTFFLFLGFPYSVAYGFVMDKFCIFICVLTIYNTTRRACCHSNHPPSCLLGGKWASMPLPTASSWWMALPGASFLW